jgi:hypothetical protein
MRKSAILFIQILPSSRGPESPINFFLWNISPGDSRRFFRKILPLLVGIEKYSWLET